MENSIGLSANELKVLSNLFGSIKIDVPGLAEKTGLSKPTVRAIVDKFVANHSLIPHIAYSPAQIGLDILTVYEVTFSAMLQNTDLSSGIRDMLDHSNHAVIVLRINPSQILIIAFYKSLNQKDTAFTKMMQYLSQKYGKDFQPVIKELWTRPSKDFYYDANMGKFMKCVVEESPVLASSKNNAGGKK